MDTLANETYDRIRDLRYQRSQAVAAARAILEAAERGGRSMTGDEQRAFDGHLAESDRLRAEIERAERLLAEQAEVGASRGTYAGGLRAITPAAPATAAGQPLLLARSAPVAARVHARSGARPDELSFERWLRAAVTGDWREARAEAEEMRALGLGADAAGGWLVPDPLSAQIIDLARAQARVIEAGALTRPIESATLTIPVLEADPTAAWKPENVEGAASDPAFGAVVVRPRTLFALVKASRELIEDAPAADTTIRDSLTAALALELDRAALRGAGAGPEPLGLRNTPNVQTLASIGSPDYDDLLQALELIQTANGAATAALLTPRDAGTLARLKDTTGQYLAPPPAVAALPRLTTTQIPTTLGAGNESEIYVGDWRRLVWAVRTQIQLEVSQEAADSGGSAFSAHQVWIKATARCDFYVEQPRHFVVLTGVTP
jgi:HK97 family phage major capsid protein